MKKITLLTLFIFAVAINAQELDEAYLASLPEDIREDVLGKMTDRDEADKPAYRRPSSMTEKPLEEDEVESNRFGMKIFNMMQSSFMPINEPNFDSSYILDFGDILQIQLTGQKNSIEQLDIKRDGSINISEIGKLQLAGLSLDLASKLINNKVKNSFIGVDAFITLVNVRDIQVLITGNTSNPGIYILNGNSNLLHALNMAGGIDEAGSFRKVEQIRDSKVIESIDLYDIFIKGVSNFSSRLRSGDIILVRPAKNLVSIAGAVNRPSTYELIDGESFSDLLFYANSFTPRADKSYIRIERLGKNKVNYVRVKEDDLSSLIPIAGDTLYVKDYVYRSITISGAVNVPGKYVINEDETLSSIIKKADGYKNNAYPFAGMLNNKNTLAMNEIAKEKLYQAYIQDLITSGSELFASESLSQVLSELKKSEVSGRIMANFDMDVIAANPELDTTLEDGDEIVIPSITQQVYIYGQVNNPGTIRYMPNRSIKDYLDARGGVLATADKGNIFVVHPNGEVKAFTTGGLKRFGGMQNQEPIYPGTVIFVPREIIKRDAMLTASIWAPIISGLALSLTSLSVLDK